MGGYGDTCFWRIRPDRKKFLFRGLGSLVAQTIDEFRQRDREAKRVTASTDVSPYQALEYELLRYLEGQKPRTFTSLSDYTSRRIEPIAAGHVAMLIHFFARDSSMHALKQVLSGCGAGRLLRPLEEIESTLNTLARSDRIQQRGIFGMDSWDALPVPKIIAPRDPDTFTAKTFAFRWCLLCSIFFGMRRQKALECYEAIRNALRTRFKAEDGTYPDGVNDLPSFQISRRHRNNEGDLDDPRPRQTLKAADVFNNLSHPAWILEVMHADYAGAIKWETLDHSREPPAVVHFVRDVLGAYLLRAKFEKGWHWRRDARVWNASIAPGQSRLMKLRLSRPGDTQPLSIKGRTYAYDYALIGRDWLSATDTKIVSTYDFTDHATG